MRHSGRIAALLTVGIVGLVLALPGLAKDKAPTGRELVQQYCKTCHGPESKNGEYTPMTYIQDQWEEFFSDTYKDSHKNVVDPKHNNQKVVDEITPKMLKKIKKFMIDHAADSEHPMTCG